MKIPIALCKRIQHSLGFWSPRRGFRIPGTGSGFFGQWNLDSGFQSLAEFRNPGVVFRITEAQDSGLQSKNLLHFSFHK